MAHSCSTLDTSDHLFSCHFRLKCVFNVHHQGFNCVIITEILLVMRFIALEQKVIYYCHGVTFGMLYSRHCLSQTDPFTEDILPGLLHLINPKTEDANRKIPVMETRRSCKMFGAPMRRCFRQLKKNTKETIFPSLIGLMTLLGQTLTSSWLAKAQNLQNIT